MNAPFLSFTVRTCSKIHLSLENGQAHVRAMERVPVEGTWVEYRCNPGFHLVGNPRSNCTKVGRWSSSKPVCERKSQDKILVVGETGTQVAGGLCWEQKALLLGNRNFSEVDVWICDFSRGFQSIAQL